MRQDYHRNSARSMSRYSHRLLDREPNWPAPSDMDVTSFSRIFNNSAKTTTTIRPVTLSELRLVDVVLPTDAGIDLRTRCVTRPSDHQRILLDKLVLKLPTKIIPEHAMGGRARRSKFRFNRGPIRKRFVLAAIENVLATTVWASVVSSTFRCGDCGLFCLCDASRQLSRVRYNR